MKVKSESEVAQSYSTLRDPMDCSLPGSSIHGIFQARVLEWGAIAFSMEILAEVFIIVFSEKRSGKETAEVQPRLIQGIRSGDGVGEDQDTIASNRY